MGPELYLNSTADYVFYHTVLEIKNKKINSYRDGFLHKAMAEGAVVIDIDRYIGKDLETVFASSKQIFIPLF